MADHSGGVSPESFKKAEEWYHRCAYHSAYSIQVFNVFVHKGVLGILCMASTAVSCSVDNANSQAGISQRQVTQNPGWWYFDMYWYPNMAMGNWWRLDEYNLGHKLGAAQEFFDGVWGNQDWRVKFAPALGQSYFHCLWSMLHALAVPYYMIVTTAPSWAGYRCLDMYQRVHVFHADMPKNEAWYVVGLDIPWMDRMDVPPTDWYRYKVFYSFGQKPIIDNWYLEPLRNSLPWQSDLSERIFLSLKPASTDPQGRRIPAITGPLQSHAQVSMGPRAKL